jgi:hypothetical protein
MTDSPASNLQRRGAGLVPGHEVALERGLCTDEGALSFVAEMCCSYLSNMDFPY